MKSLEMPLFPLKTVLFPGGTLPLRIFEPRYLSMISSCMKQNSGFGVVLIQEGEESGSAAHFHERGTVARIIDFDQLDDGMLGITCRGEQNLRVLAQRAQSDQLIIGEVELLTAEPDLPIPDHHAPLSAFLKYVLNHEQAQNYRHWLQEDWGNASWLGCRLAELLPLALTSKQSLLEMEPLQRLEALHTVMQDNELLGLAD